MYKTVIRTIPVAWLLEILNVSTAIFNFFAAVVERIASFFGANLWNLSGLDAYYVFIDENPIPIHYPKFLIGGIYDKVWFYNVRTREFTYGLGEDTTVQYLPTLTAIYRSLNTDGEFTSFDITEHITRMTFKTLPGIFPTPMQLVGAWSLHSGIWPSMMQSRYRHIITMMDGTTAEDVDVDVGLKAAKFNWLTFSEEEEVEEEVDETIEEDEETDDSEQQSEVNETEEEDGKTDDVEQSEDEEETVVDSAADVEEMVEQSKASIEEMKEVVEEMENKAKEIREEGEKLIDAIFEEMNKSCTEATEETKEETDIVKQVFEKIAEELNYKYSLQPPTDGDTSDVDMHIINQKEYFETVD